MTPPQRGYDPQIEKYCFRQRGQGLVGRGSIFSSPCLICSVVVARRGCVESLHAGYSDPQLGTLLSHPIFPSTGSLSLASVHCGWPCWVLGTLMDTVTLCPTPLCTLPSPTVKLQAVSLPSALWTCGSDTPVLWPQIPMPRKLSQAPCRRLLSLSPR